MALAGAPTLALAATCVLLAHFGGSILWVFSTVLLQLEVPDRFRGRVFAAELALVTLVTSLSSYLTAYALDRHGWSPRALSFTLGALFLVPGILWLLFQSRWQDHDRAARTPRWRRLRRKRVSWRGGSVRKLVKFASFKADSWTLSFRLAT